MKKQLKRIFCSAQAIAYTLAITAPLLVVGGSASALSGSGTSSDPYLIQSCQDLQDMNNDLTAYYQLFADIDCSATSTWNGGFGFVPISSDNLSGGFTGTLNGNGFTISGLTEGRTSSDNQGLFAVLKGTVQNLRLNDTSIVGRNYIGGLAGQIVNASVTQVEVNGIVTGQIDVGGVIGNSAGNGSTTLSRDAFNGTVTATTAWAGGLVSDMSDTVIVNSYVNATVTSGGFAGGMTARFLTSNGNGITNSYVAGSVQGTSGSGGLIGDLGGTGTAHINATFSVANTHGGAGLVAEADSTPVLNEDYFDQTANGSTNCLGGATADQCNAVNTDGTDGDYFKNSQSVFPIFNWSFGVVWQQTAEYPTLQTLDPPDGANTPDAIDNLQVVNSHTGIGLTWQAPDNDGGSPVTSYTTSYMVQGDSSWTILAQTPYGDVSSGLSLGTIVRFRVAAMNLVGTGTYTTTDYYTVGAPPDAPTALQVTPDISNFQVGLSWTAPANHGDNPITSYQVEWENTDGGDWSSPIDTGTATPSYLFDSTLSADNIYNFRVAAVSASGPSTFVETDGVFYGTHVYNIQNCVDLQNIKNDLSGNYTLAQNIDCSDTANWNGFEGFASLAPSFDNPFTGTFDGQGHTISGLSITPGMASDAALFLNTHGATINHVTLDTLTVTGNATASSLINNAIDTSIDDVHVTNATLTGAQGSYTQEGGLVIYLGNDSGDSSITDSSFNGDITGNDYIGGLVSYQDDGTQISQSYSTGTISGGDYAGGLVGEVVGSASITDAYSTMDISGGSYVGGLVGELGSGSSPNPTITNTYASGTVTGSDNVGGLVGISFGAISDSFATGLVTGDDSSTTGGFVGTYDPLDGGSSDNNAYDVTTTGQTSSYGNEPDDGTVLGVNTSNNSDVSYFKDNEVNAPLLNWDFADGIWHTNTNALPTLGPNPLGELTIYANPSPHQVIVSWAPPTGAEAPTSYELRYRVSDSNDDWTNVPIASASQTSATITGLKASTEYEFELKYTNQFATSDWLGFVLFTKAEPVPAAGSTPVTVKKTIASLTTAASAVPTNDQIAPTAQPISAQDKTPTKATPSSPHSSNTDAYFASAIIVLVVLLLIALRHKVRQK